jgi:hypothetical protein
MKVHYLHIIVIDHDALGADEVERVLEDANYPNDCIAPNVIKSQTAEVGDWDDDNPLNHSDTQAAEVARLFSAWQPIETAPKDGTVFLGYKLFLGGSYYPVPMQFLKEYDQFVNIADGYAVFVCDVSHWMPLLNPPQARC